MLMKSIQYMTDPKGERNRRNFREIHYKEAMFLCKRVRLVGGRWLDKCDLVPTNIAMIPLNVDRPA